MQRCIDMHDEKVILESHLNINRDKSILKEKQTRRTYEEVGDSNKPVNSTHIDGGMKATIP